MPEEETKESVGSLMNAEGNLIMDDMEKAVHLMPFLFQSS